MSNESSFYDGSLNNESGQSGSIATEKNVVTEGSSPLSNSQKMHSNDSFGGSSPYRKRETTVKDNVSVGTTSGYHPKNPKQIMEATPELMAKSENEV